MIELLLPYMILVLTIMVCVVCIRFAPKHKRGSANKDLTIVIPIAKTVYTVAGHFSKTSKMTAKDKVSRLIKKEISK